MFYSILFVPENALTSENIFRNICKLNKSETKKAGELLFWESVTLLPLMCIVLFGRLLFLRFICGHEKVEVGKIMMDYDHFLNL